MKSAIRLACVLIVCLAVASTTRLVISAGGNRDKRQGQNDNSQGDNGQGHDDRHEHPDIARVATGQFVSPTALRDSEQLFLNPGLAAYPNFIAGEAVRSQLSPDGTTLAILTAGHNSVVKPDGTNDVPNSTQYVFIYNVAGANQSKPLLTQVIKQVDAHVGLVFSPDGNTLYAAGGND